MIIEFALAEILMNSEIKKENGLWYYQKDGKTRAIFSFLDSLTPHGPFTIFYPGGEKWIEGSYLYGVRCDDWKSYSVSGELLEARLP